MKYEVIGTGIIRDTAEEVFDECFDRDDFEDEFENYVNEECGDIWILDNYYDAAYVLREVDSWEYDCQFDEWFDGFREEKIEDLERDGSLDLGCYEIVEVDEEEGEEDEEE